MANEKRLIDANALEKDMRAYADNKAYCGHIELANGILKAVGRIDEAPTVDAVEVVHGRWIPLEYDGYADGNPVWDLWECSECQGEHSGDEDTLTPYCPNCGAKMDGDGNA